MEQALKARQEKQSYICEHVDPNLYEEFHQFCISEAGEIDIDKWSLPYVQELVTKFKDELKKTKQREDNLERSFAVYQTTTADLPVAGELSEISEILSELDDPKVTPPQQKNSPSQQTQKQLTKSPAPSKQPSPSPSSGFTKKTVSPSPSVPTSQSTSPAPVKAVSPAISPVTLDKGGDKKITALELLDSAFDHVGEQEKSKMATINKSFFQTVNFWQVPKPDDLSPIPRKEKQFKSMKLNLNVAQLTSKSPKIQSNPQKQVQKNIQQIDCSLTKPNICIANTNALNQPCDGKSQFDTFSMIADEEIQKKRTNTQIFNLDKIEANRAKSSTIKLKEVKNVNENPSSLSRASFMKEPYKGPRIFKTDFVDHVFCAKSNIRTNLPGNLSIEIKNYDIVQRNIFSSNYLMYNMKVKPSGTVCKRNYPDFWKFRATLEKFYPAIQLPYLEKEGWITDTSEQYANKQIQMLEFFMADVLGNPELRNSRITEQFLTIPEHKKMKRKFEEYDRMAKPKSIEELCLLEGKVEVNLSEQERVYNENMWKLTTKLQTNMQKYRKNCETLSSQYNQVMTTILAIDDIVKEMSKDIQEFNRCVELKEITEIGAPLKAVRDMFKEGYFRVKFERNVVDELVLPFLRYERDNLKEAKNIQEACAAMTKVYLKRVENQNTQNADSYLNASLGDYKQGVMEESKNILVLKYQAGYLQAQASSEMQRIMNSLGNKISMLWKRIGKRYLEQLAKSVDVWSQIS